MAEKTVETEKKITLSPEIEEMMKAGLHFGHRTSRTHPKMKQYISGVRSTVHIIDLEKTKEKLDEALQVLKEWRAEGKVILFVGTKIQMRIILTETAKALGYPYVVNRWIGGTLTNFDGISKRLEHFLELERQKKEGELDKYTKKERLEIDKELGTLEMKFGGIKELEKLPDAVFMIDADENVLAIREAKAVNIPVVAITDTNINPETVTYPIPANDDALSSVTYLLEKIKEALLPVKIKPKEEEEPKEEKKDGDN